MLLRHAIRNLTLPFGVKPWRGPGVRLPPRRWGLKYISLLRLLVPLHLGVVTVLPVRLLAGAGLSRLTLLGRVLTTLGGMVVVPRLDLAPRRVRSPSVVPTLRAPVRTTGDSSVGALAHAVQGWPRGPWAGRVSWRGLSWTWNGRSGPRLRRPPHYSTTSLRISSFRPQPHSGIFFHLASPKNVLYWIDPSRLCPLRWCWRSFPTCSMFGVGLLALFRRMWRP